jgi:alginate O-acetyltransferase complex protein AlgI
MLFNSLTFIIFFPAVFLLYWFVFPNKLRHQNILLLVASYWFYANWDYRFLFLLVFSTALDYYSGLRIHNAEKSRRNTWLFISVFINLGFLAVFKYFNFFTESFGELMNGVGIPFDPWTLKLILPVGISFYTFHGLSYVFDIYNNKIKPEKDFISYSVFVCFFPLLVAGPIERATHLLPQITKARSFSYIQSVSGLRRILWGLFKKVVIADSLSLSVNQIFDPNSGYSGITLILGVIYFAIQIYCDFSGYSDIAIGCARLLGIELINNFSFPYFATSISEFWKRWHISLSSWFRDYLYIPLGGSRVGVAKTIRNIFIVFLVSGFWHGANWTFIAWGFLHAVFFLPSFINKKRYQFSIPETSLRLLILPRIVLTFTLVCFAWIFFRAESLAHAFNYISAMSLDFSMSFLPDMGYVVIFLVIELIIFCFEFIDIDKLKYRLFRYAIYTILLVMIISHSTNSGSEFIYFQF